MTHCDSCRDTSRRPAEPGDWISPADILASDGLSVRCECAFECPYCGEDTPAAHALLDGGQLACRPCVAKGFAEEVIAPTMLRASREFAAVDAELAVACAEWRAGQGARRTA